VGCTRIGRVQRVCRVEENMQGRGEPVNCSSARSLPMVSEVQEGVKVGAAAGVLLANAGVVLLLILRLWLVCLLDSVVQAGEVGAHSRA